MPSDQATSRDQHQDPFRRTLSVKGACNSREGYRRYVDVDDYYHNQTFWYAGIHSCLVEVAIRIDRNLLRTAHRAVSTQTGQASGENYGQFVEVA